MVRASAASVWGKCPRQYSEHSTDRKRHDRGHVRRAARWLAFSFLMRFAISFVVFIAHMPYNIVWPEHHGAEKQ